jgi:MFS family permease
VLGVAVAVIMTAQTALIGDYFTGNDRSALSGLQISARNFGGLVFISLAGWIAATSPRLPFAIYGVAAAMLPWMWRVIVDPPRTSRAPDAQPGDGGSGHPTWGLVFALLVLLQAATNMIFFIMPTQLSFFFEAVGYSGAVMTGSALGILTLSGGCFALLYSRVQRATGYVGIFALGYGVMALGFLLLTLTASALALFVAAALIGAGFALVSPSFLTLALRLAPLRRRGLAGGVLTSSVFLGQFCSPLLSTPLIAAHGYEVLFRSTALLLTAMAVAAVLKACATWLRVSTGLAPYTRVTADRAEQGPEQCAPDPIQVRGANLKS